MTLIVILIVVFILPLVIMWVLGTLEFGIQISTRLLARVSLLFVIVLVPMLILFKSTPSPLKDKVSMGVMLGLLLFYWSYIILQWIRRLRDKSTVLLKAVDSTISRVICLVSCAIGLIAICMRFLEEFDIRSILSLLFFLTVFGNLLIWGILGTQITHIGIFHFGHLISWDKIKSYTWGGRHGTILVLQLNKRWWKNAYIGVAPRQKDSVEAILFGKIHRLGT